jgi:hypothetical protein
MCAITYAIALEKQLVDGAITVRIKNLSAFSSIADRKRLFCAVFQGGEGEGRREQFGYAG